MRSEYVIEEIVPKKVHLENMANFLSVCFTSRQSRFVLLPTLQISPNFASRSEMRKKKSFRTKTNHKFARLCPLEAIDTKNAHFDPLNMVGYFQNLAIFLKPSYIYLSIDQRNMELLQSATSRPMKSLRAT